MGQNCIFPGKCTCVITSLYIITTITIIVINFDKIKQDKLCVLQCLGVAFVWFLIAVGVMLHFRQKELSESDDRSERESPTLVCSECSTDPVIDLDKHKPLNITVDYHDLFRDSKVFMDLLQSLKSITIYPYDVGTVHLKGKNHSPRLNRVKSYVFPKFKECFIGILSKITHLPIENCSYDVEQLKDVLGDDFVFAVLSAQFIYKNSILCYEYPSIFEEKILYLAKLSLSNMPAEARENACSKIKELLGQEVYYVGDQYIPMLKNIFYEYTSSDCLSKVHVESDFYKIADVDEQIKALKKLFVISALQYYSIYDIDIYKEKIDLASSIIKSLTKDSNSPVAKSVIDAAEKMKRLGFTIPILKSACKIENAAEIIDESFGKIRIDAIHQYCLLYSLTINPPVNTLVSIEGDYIITICDEFVGKELQKANHRKAYDALCNAVFECSVMTKTLNFLVHFALLMNKIKVEVSRMEERSLECYKEVYEDMYKCYFAVDEMISNPIDFCNRCAPDQSRDDKHYVLFTRFALKFGRDLMECNSLVNPIMPIEQEFSSKKASMVIRARIVCCFPDLLNFYSKDIKKRIKELACLRLPQEPSREDYSRYLDILEDDVLVFENKAELMQHLGQLYDKYSNSLKVVQGLQTFNKEKCFNSIDIIFSSLRYTCFYDSQIVGRCVIDSAFNHHADEGTICCGYTFLVKEIFRAFKSGRDLYVPICDVPVKQKAEHEYPNQQEEKSELLLPSSSSEESVVTIPATFEYARI